MGLGDLQVEARGPFQECGGEAAFPREGRGGICVARLAPRPRCNTSRGLCLLPTAAQGGAFWHQQKRECFPGLLCLIHLVHKVSAEDLLELRVWQ